MCIYVSYTFVCLCVYRSQCCIMPMRACVRECCTNECLQTYLAERARDACVGLKKASLIQPFAVVFTLWCERKDEKKVRIRRATKKGEER